MSGCEEGNNEALPEASKITLVGTAHSETDGFYNTKPSTYTSHVLTATLCSFRFARLELHIFSVGTARPSENLTLKKSP